MIKKILALSFLLTISFSSNAAWFFGSSGFITANDFKNDKIKGFNIGVISNNDKEYYDELSATGLNTVRVIIPFDFCKDGSKCIYSVSDQNIKNLNSLIDNSKKYNFKLIIVGKFEEKTSGDYWHSRMLQNGIAKAWQNFAGQYSSEKQIAAYDIFYNPNGNGLINPNKVYDYWTKGAYSIISSIRDVDSNHTIIYQIPTSDPMNIDKVSTLPDSNIVYGADMFYPWQITLQGTVPQYNESLLYPLGLEYRLDPFGTGNPRVINKDDLTQYLSKLKNWSIKNKVPVLISNWGIVNYAPDNSAYRYVSDTLSIFKDDGFSWMYYGFRINRALDPYIANVNGQSITRTPLAPVITELRENMKGHKDSGDETN